MKRAEQETPRAVGEPEPDGHRGQTVRPASRRRFGLRILAGIVTVAAAVTVALLLLRDGGDKSTGAAPPATATAVVERRDLVETESFDGTLAYKGRRTVVYLDPGSVSGGTAAGVAYDPDQDAAETTLVALVSSPGPDLTGETETEPPPTTEPTTTEPATEPPATTEPPTTEPPATTEPAETTEQPATGQPGSGSGGSASTGSGTGQSSSQSDGQQSAIITWLPREGATLGRGQVLYRVNGTPTVLLTGTVPAWRTIEQDIADGRDVRQLERNLVAMGYGTKSIKVDRHFGAATERAVKAWQRDLGVDDTGAVELGRVVFLPGQRRVASLEVALGDTVQSGQAILTTTSARQEVTVAVETTEQSLFAVGDSVTVELPDGSEVPGTIASIGTVATSSSDSSEQQQQQQGDQAASDATVDVTVTLDGRAGVDLDQAPVDVEVTSESAENVLAVPVTALVALLGGGYAVEVVDSPERTHLVRVEPGLYAEGYVEVTGEGIDEGTQVVVPA